MPNLKHLLGELGELGVSLGASPSNGLLERKSPQVLGPSSIDSLITRTRC